MKRRDMNMKSINNRESVLPDLLKLCAKLNRIPMVKEIYEEGIVGCSKTLKGICEENGYVDYKEFCRDSGYGYQGDVYVNGKYRDVASLILEDCIVLWNEFKEKYGNFPTKEDCSNRRQYNYNLPPQNRFNDILIKSNMSLNDFKDVIGNTNQKPDIESYHLYVIKYKKISEQLGYPLTHRELTNNAYKLPDARWLVANCPDKKVKNFNHFIEWCGFLPRYEVSKEMATKLILEKQKAVGRPLITSDFYNPSPKEVGVSTITRLWGNFNKMKQDLELEITQESLFKDITLEKVKNDLINICNKVYKQEERKIINTLDIGKYGEYSYSTHNKYLRKDNQSVMEFLNSIGFDFQQCGSGISTIFEDGEITLSQFETTFSKYLKEILNLVYNTDYIRDVKYSNFINDYVGYMDCDYIIRYKDRVIYVEIAGILRDYKDWYYENKEISSSSSKEKYRLSLQEKESMLKNNNLEYYIIFPQDCNEGFFNTIFNKEGEMNGKINSI